MARTTTGHPAASARTDAVFARVAEGAAEDSGVSAVLLGAFLTEAAAAVRRGARLSAQQVEHYERHGAEAAAQGINLARLVDLYLSAAWRLWRELPELTTQAASLRSPSLMLAGESMLRSSDDVVAAVALGYQRANTALLMRDAATRREFIDDLFANRGEPGQLKERAQPYGLSLNESHRVATAQIPSQRIDEAHVLVSRAGAAARAATRKAGLLVTSKDGRLVILAGGSAAESRRVLGRVAASLHRSQPDLTVGVGRAWAGESGPMRSYLEAIDCLRLGERLSLSDPVVAADEMVVYLTLARDPALLTDLVRTTLLPLAGLRGGAETAMNTLQAHLDHHASPTATAAALHLSVRGLTYRLERIRAVLHHDLDNPHQRLTVELALIAARLLDWPVQPLAG